MAAMKRRFTIEDKRRILELYDQLPRMSQRKAAKRLNVAPSMLWTIIHNRNCIVKGEMIKREKKTKWVGCGRSPRLEASIWKWIDHLRLNGTPITDLMIHRKAMDFATRMGLVSFRPSPRWYNGFKKREALVRERYHIYPDVNDQLGPKTAPCPASPRADVVTPQEHEESVTVSESEQDEALPVNSSSPTVLAGSVNGAMQTVTVPSVLQMQEAMKTLATGLLYRGFCNFELLHHFEKEVANVVKRSVTQGCHDSFVA